MCTTCGCGGGQTRIDGQAHAGGLHYHVHADGTAHHHGHGHAHPAGGAGGGFGIGARPGLAQAHAPGVSPARRVRIEQDILAKNNAYARANRDQLARQGIFTLNLVSSPGSGKTTLLVRTIERLRGRLPVAVIEGDQQTDNDARRIRATGAPAVQINTGKGCHLDALMVGEAMRKLDPADGSLLLVENVGNLVCPAGFDLGEHHKVAILSVTEGEDKPLKYPDMFRAADLMLLNKCDLLPYLQFDEALAIANARRVNPSIAVLRTSATTGQGLDEWLDWILAGCAQALRAAGSGVADAAGGQPARLEAAGHPVAAFPAAPA